MILRAETPIRKKKKGHYDELIESAWYNTADLRVQDLGLKSLIKEKGVVMDFTSAVRHNNADLN